MPECRPDDSWGPAWRFAAGSVAGDERRLGIVDDDSRDRRHRPCPKRAAAL